VLGEITITCGGVSESAIGNDEGIWHGNSSTHSSRSIICQDEDEVDGL
jgi:hypothetical protein